LSVRGTDLPSSSPSSPSSPSSLQPALHAALFLDRDGVLNEEVDYLHDPRDLVMIGGVAPVIADCNRRRIPVVVVSNQAGIGRGYYPVEAFNQIAQAIADQLAPHQARIDAWYHCPHRPDAGCPCRKPAPGLLRDAATALGIDLARSVLVGDKISDLQAARAAGVRAVLVRTGYGRLEEQLLVAQGRADLFDVCRDSLADAGEAILGFLLTPPAGPK
jgi:D-glycero-D-manno-heptose 1,7-bisphosphate phosphatase